jgi:glucosamine-6-phosphate deaminase
MKIINAIDYREMSRKAANIISAQIILHPNSVLGLATGSSPIGTYEQLVEWYNKGDIDFSGVTTINLDEYYGLDGTSKQSYRYFMDHFLFSRVNINMERTHLPNGMAIDIDVECKRYDNLIADVGGIDMQLLGIGRNGHIGFNEPSGAFEQTTHCVELKESTIQANLRFFHSIDEVPKRAITMGIKSIMQAKKILLIVSGEDKKEILQKALYGPVTPLVPASILQMHPDLTVVVNGN